MATKFSKMSKNQKIITTIIFAIAISSLIIISYYYAGLPTAILGIIVMVAVVLILTFKKYGSKIRLRKRPRRGWTEIQKKEVRDGQGGVCNTCGEVPPIWRYDHVDGNRSNNSMSNCQGLCPNCHDVKTDEER